MPQQRTISIIKPDAIQKNLTDKIINILESKGLRIVSKKKVHLTPEQAKEFYGEHKNKPFFPDMVKFMCSSPVVVMCLEGENAIKLNREIMGATNPQDAKVGTIRRTYGESIDNNVIHGSDSPQAAEREINFFFTKEEISA